MSDEPPLPATESDFSNKAKFPLRRFFGSLVSAFVPGAGQLLLRQYWAGLIFLSFFAVELMAYFSLRLPERYWGFVALVWMAFLLCISATSYALFGASTSPRCSRWWILAVLAISSGSFKVESDFFVLAAGFHTYLVPSTAMQDTVFPGDRIMADMSYYRDNQPALGDLILFRKGTGTYTKRVVGMPGYAVEGRNDVVYIDGVILNEPYVRHQGGSPEQLRNFGPFVVPSGQYFVAGDNRDVSYDSRIPGYGFVDRSSITGKVLYILWPITSRARHPLR